MTTTIPVLDTSMTDLLRQGKAADADSGLGALFRYVLPARPPHVLQRILSIPPPPSPAYGFANKCTAMAKHKARPVRNNVLKKTSEKRLMNTTYLVPLLQNNELRQVGYGTLHAVDAFDDDQNLQIRQAMTHATAHIVHGTKNMPTRTCAHHAAS